MKRLGLPLLAALALTSLALPVADAAKRKKPVKPPSGQWVGSLGNYDGPLEFKIVKRKRVKSLTLNAVLDCDDDMRTKDDRVVLRDFEPEGFKAKIKKGKVKGSWRAGRYSPLLDMSDYEVVMKGKFVRRKVGGKRRVVLLGDLFVRAPNESGESCTNGQIKLSTFVAGLK